MATFIAFVRLVVETLLQRIINARASRGLPYFAVCGSPVLAGKTVVITGANTGLGFETGRWLAANGAKVVLACRSMPKGEAAVAALKRELPNAEAIAVPLDLSDLDSVRACAALLATGRVDVLVLNAGVMRASRANLDHPEPHMFVNHAAHALLLLLLAPTLRLCAGRVVSVSSYASIMSDLRRDDVHLRAGHVSWFTAYANSKLAQILFARALAHRVDHPAIICVHPGESTTDVSRNLGRIWVWLHHKVGPLFLLSPRESARTIVHASIAPLDDPTIQAVRGGVLLHAVGRTITLPAHLLNDEDAEWMWNTTLEMIDMHEKEALSLLAFNN